jgi:hypothetical protein
MLAMGYRQRRVPRSTTGPVRIRLMFALTHRQISVLRRCFVRGGHRAEASGVALCTEDDAREIYWPVFRLNRMAEAECRGMVGARKEGDH